MTNLFDLTGEVAVVLGGTGVLGGAMAEALAGGRRGASPSSAAARSAARERVKAHRDGRRQGDLPVAPTR